MKNTTIDISVIIPLYNEEESISELSRWIQKVMDENSFSYEIVMIDDGSTDNSWKVVEQLAKENSSVKGIRFRRNYGKSAGLHCGFETACGDVVITMDADLQDSPDEIPGLYKMIIQDGYDLVSGWKKKRYDPVTKTIPSKFFNFTARVVTGIKLHDFNCGLKAYRNTVVKSIEVFGEMHRYIPFIVKRAGFKKIGEKVVQHQKRKFGKSKYGFERFIIGYLDLLTILFISKFGKKPMHFFGTIGTLLFLLGFGFAVYLAIEKIFYHVSRISERPLFFFSILCMILGVQLFIGGFLGELVSRSAADRNRFLLEDTIGVEKKSN